MTGTAILSDRAPAKVNLGLAVIGRRPDGYHELASVFLRLALGDTLSVQAGPADEGDSLAIEGDPACPVEDNLVLRAVRMLRSATPGGDRLPGLHVALVKRIPMGGGLAGGSTDAATALRLAARAWGLPLSPGDLGALGARLGADVPFFGAQLPAALVTGIGEAITPLPALTAPVGVLLVTPPFGMATPAVFRMHDALPPPTPDARRIVEALGRDWSSGLDGPALADRAAMLRDANDLWPAAAALDERLASLRATLERLLRRPVLLTGSGSTLVGLYPSSVTARTAADQLRSEPELAAAGLRIRATSDQSLPLEDPHP